MSDDDGDLDAFVPLRPHAGLRAGHRSSTASGGASCSSGPRLRERRPFQPKPPSEHRKVERSLLASAALEESSSSILQSALRKQESEIGGGGGLLFIPQKFQGHGQGVQLRQFGITDNKGLSNNAQTFTSGGGILGMPMPRKTKERGEGKSLELADLAFTPLRRTKAGLWRESYTPISVPYFNVTEDDNTVSAPSAGHKGRPQLHHVDERNSNAARELFLNEDGDLQEDRLFLLQLPAVLPELVDPTEEPQRGEDEEALDSESGPAPTLTRLPDGRVGKLKIHKSGKVRIEIGGLPYCVDQGAMTFFQQEVGCVCPQSKEYVNLGSVQNRVVLTPDIGALLADLVDQSAAPTVVPTAAVPGAAGVSAVAAHTGAPRVQPEPQPLTTASAEAGAAAGAR